MVMALSRPMKRNTNTGLSVLVGFEETAAFCKKVSFANDGFIGETVLIVDETEKEREEEFKNIRSAMDALIDSEKKAGVAVGELTEQSSWL